MAKKPKPKGKGAKDKHTPGDQLTYEPSLVRDRLTEEQKAEVMRYAQEYLGFIDRVRTERQAAAEFLTMARESGFVELSGRRKRARGFFQAARGKVVALAVSGKRPLTEGARIIVSHTDCPRLDLKPNPLYEDTDLALLKSHYYGGIKKYHWVARPLALVGAVILGDGRRVQVEIGLKADDPVITIPDLLPHLARKQMEKKANEFVPAENLNILVGCLPADDQEADQRVKQAVLRLLNERYGITEEDFTSAEFQVVPAEPAREAGLDRGFIAAYGHDDRVCAYTSFTALLETVSPEHAAVVVFFDKEEIGSEGNTSAQSRFLEMLLMELMEKEGLSPSVQNLNRVYLNSKAFSADVNAGFDPTYPDVFDKRNACKMGYGVVIEKYTGHGGKYMASDASAEYSAWVRNLFNAEGVVWQTGGHGKVDEGGGGTIAKFLARTGMDVIDVGPALLGMHSPLELVCKDDVWMCHRAFRVFLEGGA
jgi:aspartyl aminopeptidase